MSNDPFDFDGTDFAQGITLANNAGWSDDEPKHPPHPALDNFTTKEVHEALMRFKEELWRDRHPDGAYDEDVYFMLEEGMVLRPEVVVHFILWYLGRK